MESWVKRSQFDILIDRFTTKTPHGVILAGVVGSGKTFLVAKLCDQLSRFGFTVLKYDGDDVGFRSNIKNNSQLIVDRIQTEGIQHPLVVVDEIQKEPEILDAVKSAHDKLGASFIVTGSNPAYLRTEANHRLQRRAAIYTLLPFSLPEILRHRNLVKKDALQEMEALLWESTSVKSIRLEAIAPPTGLDSIVSHYLIYGGLPLAHLAKSPRIALEEIRLVSERGITQTYHTTVALDDEVRQYLALNNSREFTYQGIQQKLRNRKRHSVIQVIDHLMNHGYLYRKRPFLGKYEHRKTTYLSTYSWVDPGIVSYYTANTAPTEQEQGFRLEAYIHGRLLSILERIPVKSNLYYYKPMQYKKSNDSLSFLPGEIDFVVQLGSRLIPIEVKMGKAIRDFELSSLMRFAREFKSPFGIVFYSGAPFVDHDQKLIFYPYWGV